MVNGGAIATPSTATFRRVRVVSGGRAGVQGRSTRRTRSPLVEARFDDIPEERDKIR